jgi:hypothetical protein
MRPLRLLVGLAALALTGCDDPTTPSSDTTERSAPDFRAAAATDNETFVIEQPVFVDCANEGNGEVVVLRGNLHTVPHDLQRSGSRHHQDALQPAGGLGRG